MQKSGFALQRLEFCYPREIVEQSYAENAAISLFRKRKYLISSHNFLLMFNKMPSLLTSNVSRIISCCLLKGIKNKLQWIEAAHLMALFSRVFICHLRNEAIVGQFVNLQLLTS